MQHCSHCKSRAWQATHSNLGNNGETFAHREGRLPRDFRHLHGLGSLGEGAGAQGRGSQAVLGGESGARQDCAHLTSEVRYGVESEAAAGSERGLAATAAPVGLSPCSCETWTADLSAPAAGTRPAGPPAIWSPCAPSAARSWAAPEGCAASTPAEPGAGAQSTGVSVRQATP